MPILNTQKVFIQLSYAEQDFAGLPSVLDITCRANSIIVFVYPSY